MTDEAKDVKQLNEAGRKRGLSRRNILYLGGMAAAASFLPILTARAGNAAAEGQAAASAAQIAMAADFRAISEFLTGKPIEEKQAERTWQALCLHDKGFSGQYQALRDFILSSSAKNIDELKGNTAFSSQKRQTALAVISAYYLGYVGTPKSLRAHDDVIFITYTQALMYQLTYAQVPIPTYSRWDSGFWANPPMPG